jgi:TIR domain/SIR2-like domain
MSQPEIFLSYAWGGDSEKIVNDLDNAFQKKGITLIRDKRDLGFKGMITEFMQRIGKGQAVVLVISDKYLKSPYCMFELLEIYRNLDFKNRIFPIVLKDANIFESIPKLQYLEYWRNKKKELDDAIMKFGSDAITVVGDDYKINKKIFDNYGEIVNILKDINSLTPDMHQLDNFITLIDAVEKLINNDKSQSEERIEPINWKFIVRQIEKQKCILFLGPELFRTKDNARSRQEEFFENLAIKNPQKILSYNHDGFFLFSSPEEKTRLFKEINDFFEERNDEDIVQKIAEIPFHVVVSINPDISLKRFFVKNNYPHVFEFFDKKIKKDIAETPSIKKPLIYNLFGSVTNLDTLILSHDDLFEYFRALMGNNVLPQELRTALESATNYIFLGFQFDKWYIQLILSLLKLNDKQYNFIRYASANTISNDTKSLCINHYRIQFIGADNNVFINTLHDKCKEAGLLRDFSLAPGVNFADEKEKDLRENIDRENKLLQEYEQLQNDEKDPIKQMDIEDNIEAISKKIAQYEKELESIFQTQS